MAELTIDFEQLAKDAVDAELKRRDLVSVVRCRDCRFYTEDKRGDEFGYPGVIIAHEICEKWGNGCKTSENGYCFLGERKEKTDG